MNMFSLGALLEKLKKGFSSCVITDLVSVPNMES